MSWAVVARRSFSLADQLWFAALSGDWNPVHVDPLAARRTVVGQPVVHGMHLILWAIDEVGSLLDGEGVGGVQALFLKPAYLGVPVELRRQVTPDGDRLELHGSAGALATIQIARAPIASPASVVPRESGEVGAPRERAFGEAAAAKGELPLTLDATALDARYPRLASALGHVGVASLCALSRMVGMELPGLRSLLGGLKLTRAEASGSTVAYRVVRALRPQLPIRIAVEGPGFSGHVDALFRPPPVAQPGMAQVAQAVARMGLGAEFEQKALVVGGSRGLGEVLAKLVAAGGGEIALTYHRGEADAERVAAQIREGGGRCQVARLDVCAVGPELSRLAEAWGVTHLYYLATPPIGSLEPRAHDPALRARFEGIYVGGFRAVVRAVANAVSGPLRVFYPSSVAVTEPRLEYAEAKRAGEQACDELVAEEPRLGILRSRLPRLHTDQTLSLLQRPGENPLDRMLRVVRSMQDLELGRVHDDD